MVSLLQAFEINIQSPKIFRDSDSNTSMMLVTSSPPP